MDGSAIGGALLPGSAGGMLDLDPSLHQPPSLHHHQQALTHHLQGLAPLSSTQHVTASQDSEQSLGYDPRSTPKPPLVCYKGKSAGTSDEDEPSFTEDGGDVHLGGKSKKTSPWHRMKWTDSMVRLLISVVMFVGEDGVTDNTDGSNKRKSGMLQKKGKWKSVSRVMMERGCYVSPQQCEDKFNDLNKRYKRLNDILGRGTACCIVENPSLLDSMVSLSSKTKEDVKKLLSSKHLFYKEMCSYHSGCKSLVPADMEFQPSIQAGMMVKSGDLMEFGKSTKDDNFMDDEDEDEDEEEDGEEEEEDNYADHGGENVGDAEVEALGDLPSPFRKGRKSCKYSEEGNFGSLSGHAKNVNFEAVNNGLMGMMQDGSKLTFEQQQWMRTRTIQLEEQKVTLQAQAFELEKQRFKWQKFSYKKDQELEMMSLENERMKLENERISLQLKQKELEIESKRSEASMASIAFILERLQSNEHSNVGR